MEKTRRTSRVLVPFALCAMGVWAFIFAGCSKREPAAAAPSHAPENYMNDPVFRKELADKRAARNELAKVRSRLVKELEKKLEAKRLELGVACTNGVPLARKLNEQEEARVRAMLESDPEWKSLCQRCIDANQALRDNQKATQRIVRERITPKTGREAGKSISK